MPGGTASSHFAVVEQAMTQMKKLGAYITAGMDSTIDITSDLLDHDKDTSEDKLNEMRDIMLQYVKMDQELANFVEAMDHVKPESKKSENDDKNLEEILDAKLQELKEQNKDQALGNHKKFKDLEGRIDEIKSADDSLSATQTPATVDLDADIAMTQQPISTKCPYTGKEMKDPVRNIHCAHNYEREGIAQLMKTRKGKAKCPVAGCINDKVLEPSDLEDNPELKKKINQQNRQAAKRGKKS